MTSEEIVLDDFDLPGLAELKGRWRGSLDASGGGNGDTTVDILAQLVLHFLNIFIKTGKTSASDLNI